MYSIKGGSAREKVVLREQVSGFGFKVLSSGATAVVGAE
jgi:hypothetical protein